VLLLNHVLMQEKEATDRLARQKGRIVHVKWRSLAIEFVATPAGLLDLADPAATPDLVLVATQESPLELAQAFLRGDKPEVRIEGDVQLAAEVNWLTEHVRWDIEDDLSRVIGDVPAHTLGQFARRAAQTLRDFVKPTGTGANPGAPQ
jgi:ubiquinone biosynthesis accessory factor UbiJ